MSAFKTPEVVIWGDGGGTTFQAVVDAVGTGLIDLSIAGVVSTDPEAGIFDRVNAAKEKYNLEIPHIVVSGEPGKRQSPQSEGEVLDFLDRVGTPNLALLGCMTTIEKD